MKANDRCYLLEDIPREVQLNIYTYLRACDLSAVQMTCTVFNKPEFIESILHHMATYVYTPELTEGYDSPRVAGQVPSKTSFQALRNMEMLVVARVLSRPEPRTRDGGFYVSKSWCKTALQWLEVQQEHHAPSLTTGSATKKKKSKKQERMRQRRLSEVSPPWPNVNSDILCTHQNLQMCSSSKSARARRRVMDKQAWKVLKKLYPDSVSLESVAGECLQCALESETTRKSIESQKQQELLERKKPLSCPIVRGIYTRNRAVPLHRVRSDAKKGTCPLQPGIYHVLPRSWCHAWRKYIKGGEGDRPCAPEASALLCDAHRLPLIPPHLEAYLYGETSNLLAPIGLEKPTTPETTRVRSSLHPVGWNPVDRDNYGMAASLRAAGLSPVEMEAQRLAMLQLEREQRRVTTLASMQTEQSSFASSDTSQLTTNQLLDKQNKVVVEIVTQEEFSALDSWWSKIHSSYVLSFEVTGEAGEDPSITWSTLPCRDCDASGMCPNVVFRNRSRPSMKKTPSKTPSKKSHQCC